MILSTADIQRFIDRYYDNPVRFVREVIKAYPTLYQRKWLMMVARNPRAAIRANRGPGKTTVASWLVLWFLATRALAKIVVTGPTFDKNIKEMFWPELRKWIGRSEFLTALLDVEKFHVRVRHQHWADVWYAVGTSSADPDNMEGFHAPHLMYVVDEAKSVDRGIFKAISGSLTDSLGEQRMLAISTPAEKPLGYFYDIFSKWRDRWSVASIDAFTAMAQGARISAVWIEEKREELGEGTPAWQSQVMGEFPDQGVDSLIPLSWIEAAVRRHPEYSGNRLGQKAMQYGSLLEAGMDVAEGGLDNTILTFRRGLVQASQHKIIGNKQRVIANKADALVTSFEGRYGELGRLKVEKTGPGGGVGEKMTHAVQWFVPGGRARKRDRFENCRAESWWQLRLRFEDGRIAILDDAELIADLTAMSVDYTARGRMKMLDKDTLRSELGRSPDKGDALMIAYARLAGISGKSAEMPV